MLHDQLAATCEEIGKRYAAGRTGEDVVFTDLNPGQLAAAGGELILKAEKFLFLMQKFKTGGAPLVFGDDGRGCGCFGFHGCEGWLFAGKAVALV